MRRIKHFQQLAHNFITVIGIVLVWRGIWLVVDAIDVHFFGGSHFWTGLLGVLVGLVVLYLPDSDIKELTK